MVDGATVWGLDGPPGVERAAKAFIAPAPDYEGEVEAFEVVSMEIGMPDLQDWYRPPSQITGFAYHHDGVHLGQSSSVAVNSNASRQRMQAIYDHHVRQEWNGIGYHAVIDPWGRIYVPRWDVLRTHRAHVGMGGLRHSPGPDAPRWNHQLIGVCFMGHYSDGLDLYGQPSPMDRPTDEAIAAADAWCRAVTNGLGHEMTLRPHSYYQRKPCPGTWVNSDTGWEDFVFEPAAAIAPPSPVGGVALLPGDLAMVHEQLDRALRAAEAASVQARDASESARSAAQRVRELDQRLRTLSA